MNLTIITIFFFKYKFDDVWFFYFSKLLNFLNVIRVLASMR